MSTMTAENVLPLVTQLPPAERAKLLRLLEEQERQERRQHNPTAKPPRDKRLPNRPAPDSTREMQWLAENSRAYAGQWVALAGDRLIAASTDHEKVFAAVDAAGVQLPLITFVEDPDHPVQIIWA